MEELDDLGIAIAKYDWFDHCHLHGQIGRVAPSTTPCT